jgi:6-phosphofructokinase
MNALEHWEATCTLTCEGVKDDDVISKNEVKEVMDWWLKMAGWLLEISKFSKSQKKVTDERLKNFKCNLLSSMVLLGGNGSDIIIVAMARSRARSICQA